MTINGANFTVTATTLCNDGSVEKYFTGGAPSGWSVGALGSGGFMLPGAYYLPQSLQFISWDFPNVVASGIDVDYKMTGYDWFNRTLGWSIDSGPSGMTIDSDGTIHWTPSTDNTTESVTVGLTFDGGSKITKTFTISVDNSRCVFISTTGNDANAGTVDAPIATLEQAAVMVNSANTSRTIYHRGGMYTKSAWNWYSGGSLQTLAEKNWSETEQLTIRNYPGETVEYSVTGNGMRLYGTGNVILGIAVDGATSSETANILIGRGVAKKCVASNANWAQSGNCTGFKHGGGSILDACTSYNNYDRSDPSHHNSSNYLYYGTAANGDGEAFVIDCIDDSLGSNRTSCGFKIKHAGINPIHYHRCAAVGSDRPFATVQNGGSIRASIVCNTGTSGALTLGVTDPSTGGNTDTDEAMLVQGNAIASSQGFALSVSHWALFGSQALPLLFDDNDIEAHGSVDGAVYVNGQYDTPAQTPYRVFSNNRIYASSESNAALQSEVAQPLSWLIALGDGNSSVATRTLSKTINGRTFEINAGVCTEV